MSDFIAGLKNISTILSILYLSRPPMTSVTALERKIPLQNLTIWLDRQLR